MTALLSKMSIFLLELDARYDWWVMAPNVHCSLFPISSSCIYMYLHVQLEKYRSYMDIQHIKRLLYYQRHFLCVLELHERSHSRATAPDTHLSFSDTTLCAYTVSLYIHRYFVRNYVWQQNSRTLWLHSWLTTLHVTASFQLIVHANIKITNRYYRILIYEFAAKQHKGT